MIDVLHLVRFGLLLFTELAFPVFVKQIAGPVGVGLRRPECNDFLQPGSAGKKLDDFAPVRGSAVTVPLQTALDDFLEFRPPAPPTGERAGRADQWSLVCSNLTTGRRPLLGILILCHTWPCDDNIG